MCIVWRCLHSFVLDGHQNLELPKESLVQEQHAAALNKCPHTARADAAEPTRHTLGAVDDAQASQDGRGLEGDGAGSRPVSVWRRRRDVSDLGRGMVILGGAGLGWGVDLGLQPCLDDIERASDDTGKAASRGAGEELEGDANVTALLVLAGPCGELLPEHELQGREGQVAVEGGLVAIKESRDTFSADNGAGSVEGAPVVVARYEMRVVVTALELKSGFQNLGWDVDDGGG